MQVDVSKETTITITFNKEIQKMFEHSNAFVYKKPSQEDIEQYRDVYPLSGTTSDFKGQVLKVTIPENKLKSGKDYVLDLTETVKDKQGNYFTDSEKLKIYFHTK